jgi:hypothetical protein
VPKTPFVNIHQGQGDQIGRIFAYRAIIFLGQVFFGLQTEGAKIFWLNFSTERSYAFILANKRVGQHFGRFFPNSSGHPNQGSQF